jgi:hypothetical protein
MTTTEILKDLANCRRNNGNSSLRNSPADMRRKIRSDPQCDSTPWSLDTAPQKGMTVERHREDQIISDSS